MKLKELVEQHPDWLEYEMAVYRSDGNLDYVGASGMVFVDDEFNDEGNLTGNKVIIFSGN